MAESRWTGQRDRDHRDLVAGSGVGKTAHAHRNHRLQRLCRPLAVVLQERSHRARDRRQADIVERAPDAARRPQLVAPRVVADQRATRADRHVERTRRRRGENFLGGRTQDAPGTTEGTRNGRRRVGGGARPRAHRAHTVGQRPRHRVQRPTDATRTPPWLPGDRRLRRHVRLGIENQADDLQRGKPIDQRVMDLADHPHPPILEPGDQEDLPQRPRPVQRSRKDGRAKRLKARVADRIVRRRERHDVGAKIKPDVIDPPRLGQAQRRRIEPPATPRHLVQPPRRPLAQRLHRRARTSGWRSEHRAEANMHMRLRRLQAQERAVQRRQPPAVILAGGARRVGDGVPRTGLRGGAGHGQFPMRE